MATTKLFVGNLNFRTTQEALRELFSPCGVVKSVEISNARGPRGFGFVEMETVEAAQKALTDLNKRLVDERELNVEFAKPPRERTPRQFTGERRRSFSGPRRFSSGPRRFARRPRAPPTTPPTPSPTRVYVNNIPWATDDAALSAHFAQFNPKSANVVRRPNGSSWGYGFVEFETSEQQQAAIAALNNSTLGDRQIACKQANLPVPRAPATTTTTTAPGTGTANPTTRPPRRPFSGPRRNNFRGGPRRGPRRQQGPPQPDSQTRVFVANLPFSVNDEELAQMFSERYPVKEAHVATWPGGQSRGFGFVDFADHDSQKGAIETFHQQHYGDRVVTVRVAREPRPQNPATPAQTAPPTQP